MNDNLDVETAKLSDAELITLLKNHGMSRRWLMRLFGAGAVVSAVGGTAAAKPGGASIDAVYGSPYEASESVPKGIVDQVVELHLHEGETHPGFPGIGVEFFFDPVGVHLTTQEVINFDVHSGLHTVTSIHSKFDEPGVFAFPDRVPTGGFTSPVMNVADSWLYRFTTPGVYDIMCLPHYDLGMVVRVVVTAPNGSVPEDTYDDSLLPPAAEAVFDAPELTPANIVEQGTVAWADLSL